MSDVLDINIDDAVDEINALFGEDSPVLADSGGILGIDLSDLAADLDLIGEQINLGSEGIPEGDDVPLCPTNENPVPSLCEVFVEGERLDDSGVVDGDPALGDGIGARTGEASDIDTVFAEVDDAVGTGLPEFESEASGAWTRYERMLPVQVRDLLLACVRRDDVRDRVIDRLHREFLLRDVNPDLHDAATIRDAWRTACSPEKNKETLRLTRQVRDDLIRTLHLGATYQRISYSKVPTFLTGWKPVSRILKVAEVGRTVPSLGWSAFLEQTPPVVIRYVYESWLAKALSGAADASALLGRKVNAVDFMGGSGTVLDVLRLFGVDTYSYDLTSANEQVATLDMRAFERHFETPPRYSLSEPEPRAPGRPDLVFIDPPSRGTPTHAEIYGLGEREEDDLAGLDRSSWIETVTGIVTRVLPYLATGGAISLLVRAGVRDRGRVDPDSQLVADVKAALGSSVKVIEEVAIEFGVNRVRQASLAQARVPATHLLLGKPA